MFFACRIRLKAACRYHVHAGFLAVTDNGQQLIVGHGDRLLRRSCWILRVSCPRARSSAAEQETLNLSVVGSSPTGLTIQFVRKEPPRVIREGSFLCVGLVGRWVRRRGADR